MKKVWSVLVGGILICFLYVGFASAQATGKEIVNNVCTQCHTLDRVKSAKKSAAAWESTLNRMIKKGAEVSPAERDKVLKYLRNINKLS